MAGDHPGCPIRRPPGFPFTLLFPPTPLFMFQTRHRNARHPNGGFPTSLPLLKTCLSTKESPHCLFLLLASSSDDDCCILVPIDKVGFQFDSHRRPLDPGVGAATAALRPPATGAATAAHSVEIRAV